MKARTTTAVLVATVALAACGESDEEKAQNKVCDARAGISRQIDSLQQLTPATVTIDGVRKSVQAIGDDLNAIKDAQGDLADDRREGVQSANDAFAAEIRNIGSTLLRSTSVQDAGAQLTAAVDKLAASYRDSLGKVDCS